MDNHFYQLKNKITSLINVTNNVYQNTFFNEETDENYLNTGINLTKLENGDYILVNEYITSDDENNKHIALKYMIIKKQYILYLMKMVIEKRLL